MVFIVGRVRILDDVVYGVWLIIRVQNGRLVKVLFNMGDIEASENFLRERCSVLETKSLGVNGEFLVVISLDSVTQVILNESAWMHGMRYEKVLVERDSNDEKLKLGEISEVSVTLNESTANSTENMQVWKD